MYEWVEEKWCMYTLEYVSAIQKNEFLPPVTALINAEGIRLNEVGQIEKYPILFNLYMEY